MEYSTLNEQRSRKPENTAMTVRRMRSMTLAPVETTAMIGVLVSEFARCSERESYAAGVCKEQAGGALDQNESDHAA